MTKEMMYDPPSGWLHGFPRPYRPIEGETVAETLVRDGYPANEAEFAAKHCRSWEVDTAARLAVEGAPPKPLSEKCIQTSDNDNVRHVAEATGRTGFVYLGSPYSKQTILDEAAYIAERAAARLMAKGMVVYSPIAHGHAIAGHGLPTGWDFWKAQCQPFIDAADSMIVLMMDGWEDSVGLTYEIEEFARQGKMVSYVEPDDLFDRIDNPHPEYPTADREASAADRLYQARKEGVA